MSEREQVHALMREIGPILDLAEVYEGANGNIWTLARQDGAILFVEFTQDDNRLWLSAEVGTPRIEDRARLYPLLLQYNARWQETGGVRLALDAPEGVIIQAYDMPAAELDVPRFVTAFRNFGTVLEGWRSIVTGAGGGHMPAAPAADITSTGIIRG